MSEEGGREVRQVHANLLLRPRYLLGPDTQFYRFAVVLLARRHLSLGIPLPAMLTARYPRRLESSFSVLTSSKNGNIHLIRQCACNPLGTKRRDSAGTAPVNCNPSSLPIHQKFVGNNAYDSTAQSRATIFFNL